MASKLGRLAPHATHNRQSTNRMRSLSQIRGDLSCTRATSVAAAIRARARREALRECTREVALIDESAAHGDRRERLLGRAHEPRTALDATAPLILRRRAAEEPAERTREIDRMDASVARDVAHRELV